MYSPFAKPRGSQSANVLPGSILRKLTAEEMDMYRAPFRDPKSRTPMWRWPNEIPLELRRPPPEDHAVRAGGARGELGEEPRLADARVADHLDGTGYTLRRGVDPRQLARRVDQQRLDLVGIEVRPLVEQQRDGAGRDRGGL